MRRRYGEVKRDPDKVMRMFTKSPTRGRVPTSQARKFNIEIFVDRFFTDYHARACIRGARNKRCTWGARKPTPTQAITAALRAIEAQINITNRKRA